MARTTRSDDRTTAPTSTVLAAVTTGRSRPYCAAWARARFTWPVMVEAVKAARATTANQ
jgi:hypothetical protein